MREYSANLVSKDKKYAIVVARFNHFITDRLVEGCLDALKRHEVKDKADLLWCSCFPAEGSGPDHRSYLP